MVLLAALSSRGIWLKKKDQLDSSMGFFGGSDSADDAEAKKKPSGVASALRSAGHATGLVEKTEEEKTCEDKCEEAIPLTWTQVLFSRASSAF